MTIRPFLPTRSIRPRGGDSASRGGTTPSGTGVASRRAAAATAVGATVVLAAAACGSAPPEPVPGQSPSAYSGVEVSEDRIEYAIGKLPGIVEEELEASGVPGAAVAVVHGGEMVMAEGFGVRDTTTGTEVDPDTVFPMASISKSVSATVVAAETADGEVSWSTPVRDHLPWFELSDPVATREVTVGDLFSHRTGLPEHGGDDLEDLGYSREEVLRGLRYLPLTPFRASYAYTNFGLTAGAEAVAAAAGTSWEDLARERIFGPLGMTESSYSYEELITRDNRAVGHVPASPAARDGSAREWVPADPAREPDAQAPAGGLSSSAVDMATWMQMVLDEGVGPDGGQVVPADALLAALTPQAISGPPKSPVDRTGTYGYGFNVSDTSSGRVQWSHSGAFALGAATAFTMIPSLDLGIVTLTNASPVGVPEIINARFMDYVQYGDPAQNWRELATQQFASMLDPLGDLAGEQKPSDPAPSPRAEQLLGVYRNDYFGDVEVREASGSAPGGDPTPLVLLVGPDRTPWPLEHWDGNVFAVSPSSENWAPGTRGSVTFEGDTVTVQLLDTHGLGTFTRVPSPDSP